jgi:hypothetical protein
MQKNITNGCQLGIALLFLAAGSAFAETRVDQVWTCTLNANHTVKEMAAAQAAWVAWANKEPYGAKIRGNVAATMVSSNLSVVLYIDSYPDMATLAADQTAYDSAEGRALQARFDELTVCSAAALYNIDDGKM